MKFVSAYMALAAIALAAVRWQAGIDGRLLGSELLQGAFVLGLLLVVGVLAAASCRRKERRIDAL